MGFTRALARRLTGSGVVAACLHPGVIATAIGDNAGLAGFGWRLVKPFLATPEKGAATTLFLATVADPSPFHGAYVVGNEVKLSVALVIIVGVLVAKPSGLFGRRIVARV